MAKTIHGYPLYPSETFSIHGMRLAVASDAAWVREGVCDALCAFRAPIAVPDAAMVLMAGRPRAREAHIPGGDADGAAGAAFATEPVQFRFGGMRCQRAGERLVYSDGASTIIVDPLRRRAEGTVCRRAEEPPGAPWRAWGEAVFAFALLELLRHHGLYHLHAAAVEQAGAGVLIAGDTGSGKTTLTVMLARGGWGFLSDDAVLLRLTEAGVEARALPLPFHVDPALGAALPELKGLRAGRPYNGGPKREMDPESAFGRGFLPSVQPRLVLLPTLHRQPGPPPADAVGPGLWLRRLSAGQAVAELIRSSALVLLDERAAAGHLESLRRLATGCATYRLYHGPEALQAPDTLAASVAALLARAAERNSAGRPPVGARSTRAKPLAR